ncbi:MAG: sugar ABC transporter substrate-binding protein [Kofleriaceae bacterium]
MTRAARASSVLWGVASWLVLGACERGGDGGVTLQLWAMGREGEVVPELTAEFERLHPGVRVDVQQLPWTSAHEKLLTAFVGEATPDVAQLGNTWLPELAALGALQPLDTQVEASAREDGADGVVAGDYFPGIWATNQVGGALYGVPWYVDTRLLFYRQDLLAAAGYPEVPTTWAGWLEAMQAIKRQVGPERYAILLPVNEFEQLLTLALSAGEPLLRDGDRYGNFRGAGFRRALTFYLDLFRRELAPVATETQISNVWAELDRGYFTFMFHGPWSIGEFQRRLPAARQRVWMTAPMPGPTGPGAGIAGGSSLVVFRRARHPELAWQLVEFLSRPSSQRRFHALTGDLPPRRASWRDAALAADPHVHAFRDQLERVRRAPPVPEWERIMTELRLVSERAVHRVGPRTTDAELAQVVAAAAAELDARVDELLDKRRWMLAREEHR